MDYICRVGTPAGEVLEQTFSATDETALRAELQQKGLYVFSVRRGLGLSNLSLWRRRVPTAVLLVFGQELAALLKAGLPLFQALDVLLERQRDPLFRQSLLTVREKVKAGVSLSDAFRAEGGLYPPIFAASLLAGERSGSLEAVLRRFVRYLRLTEALKKKAISASVYPVLLFTVMTAIVIILLVFVIPEFQGFYEGLGAQLPWETRALLALAAGLRDNLVWIVLGIVALSAGLAAWLRRPEAPVAVDRGLLRLPLVGPLMGMYSTSQLARTLSTLLAGGLPLLSAMEVAAASVGNRALAADVAAAAPQIREGRSLSAALGSATRVDALAVEMVRVGEQTGALGDMLDAVADFYDEEVDGRLLTLLALVEPVMLLFMATVVAGTLLAFYLPLFQVFSLIH